MPPQVIHVRNASKVAAALSNEKCQKILEYLGKHADTTETKLSKELTIPLSTVHYNMKVLMEAKLILGNEYTYSAKGKEVTHYRINKNPIVIVQEEQQLDFLKALVPAALITAAVGIGYSFFTAAPIQQESYRLLAKSADAAPAAFAQTAPSAIDAVAQTPNMLPWFFAGAALILILSIVGIVVIRWINKKYL